MTFENWIEIEYWISQRCNALNIHSLLIFPEAIVDHAVRGIIQCVFLIHRPSKNLFSFYPFPNEFPTKQGENDL